MTASQRRWTSKRIRGFARSFYTPTNEVAPFRVVENDYGLSVDRLTYFGCMDFGSQEACAAAVVGPARGGPG